MAEHRLSSNPHAREMVPYRFPPTDQTGSDVLDDLASSRPIPLSALSSKANSRNKGSKLWKPLPLDEFEETNDHAGNPSISDGSHHGSRSQLSVKHHSSGDHASAKPHQRGHTTRSRLHLQDRSLDETPAPKQAWSNAGSASVQRNPLSYSSGYDSSERYSLPQQQGFISESPFQRQENHLRLESLPWTVHGPPMLTGVPSRAGIQHHQHLSFPGGPPILENRFNSRETGTSNPYIQWDSAASPNPHSRRNPMNISEPAPSTMHPFKEPNECVTYRRLRSDVLHPKARSVVGPEMPNQGDRLVQMKV